MEAQPEGVRKLDLYQIGHSLARRIHAMTLDLPRFEMFEEGSQIRKSSKSVTALLIEGYRLRKYRDNFLYYLRRALGSADETKEHLEYLFETHSFQDPKLYQELAADCERVISKLVNYIRGVEANHAMPHGVS